MTDKTSYGICKVFENKDSLLYVVHCDCHSKEHVHELYLSFDEEFPGEITLNVGSDLGSYIGYRCQGRFNCWWKEVRVKAKIIWKLLFTDYYYMNSDLILKEKAIHTLIVALSEGLVKLQTRREAVRSRGVYGERKIN